MQDVRCEKSWSLSLVVLFFFPSIVAVGQLEQSDSTVPLGQLYYQQGIEAFETNFDSCIHYLGLAAPLLEKASHKEDFVNCYNGLFYANYLKGEFEAAESYGHQALAAARRYLSEDDEAYVSALNNLGVILDEKRDFERALANYQRTYEIIQMTTNDKEEKAIALYNISNTYFRQGDFDAAITYLRQSLQLNVDTFGLTHPRVARLQYHLGRAFQRKGNIEEALNYYAQSYQILGAHPDREGDLLQRRLIDVLQRMGEAFLEWNKPDSTRYYLNQALTLQRGTHAYRKYLSHEIYGHYYFEAKDYENAIFSYSQALDLATIDYEAFEKHEVLARLRLELGRCFLQQGLFEKALEQFQSGLIINALDFENRSWEANPAPATFISPIEGVKLLAAKGQALLDWYQATPASLPELKTSFVAYQTADQLIQYARGDLFSHAAKEQLAETVLPIYEKAIEVGVLLSEQTGQVSYLEKTFDLSERTKSIILLEVLNMGMQKSISEIPDSVLAKEKQLTIDLAFYERKIMENLRRKEKSKPEQLRYFEKQRTRLQQAQLEMAAKMQQDYPKYRQSRYQRIPRSLASIQEQILDTTDLLIEYFVGSEKIFAFALTSTQLSCYSMDKPENFEQDVEQLLQIFRSAPTTKQVSKDYAIFAKPAWQLYDWLLKPALSAHSSDIDKLIIVPDGLLNLLPFEVLLSEKPADNIQLFNGKLPYLFKKFQLSYGYSCAVLADSFAEKSYQPSASAFLGMAPSFEQENTAGSRNCFRETLYGLQCSEVEISKIGKLMRGKTLIGEKASRAQFENLAHDYRVIHLATHACSDGESPMFNRIFFTDDYISNYDLINVELNAELVVLSACNTGGGKIVPGEGIMSLAKGFLGAGASSTLISLWAIDDCTTSEMMVKFYQHLAIGTDKDLALQQARFDFLSEASRKYQHPYYWAPFILVGNHQAVALDTQFASPLWLWVILLPIGWLLYRFWNYGTEKQA